MTLSDEFLWCCVFAADHLFEAALRGSSDDVAGVSECIIMGTFRSSLSLSFFFFVCVCVHSLKLLVLCSGSPIPVGTGLFSLMQNVQKTSSPSTEGFSR